MSSITNIPLALLKLQQKPMYFFGNKWKNPLQREKKPTKSPDGSTHRKAQTNVIVAKVSPSKTPENNPMKYISREKHHNGPDEEFFPHFIKYGGSVFFSTFPIVWDQNFLQSVIKKFLCWE